MRFDIASFQTPINRRYCLSNQLIVNQLITEEYNLDLILKLLIAIELLMNG